MDIKYKLYPYPVLWNKLDDYNTSKFDCEIKLQREIKKFVLNVEFNLDNKQLEEMIEKNLVEYVLHIESPATSYRILEKSAAKTMNIILNDERLLGKISLCPFIVAKQELKDFSNEDWNEDYKGSIFSVSKGTILAIGTQQTFTVDKENEDLSTVPSIFTMYKKETAEAMPVEVEVNSDKIQIGLNILDYDRYATTKYDTEDSVNIVNAFLIYPVLVFMFERLKENFEEYVEYRWFKAINKMLDKYSMKLDEDFVGSKSSLELSQILMGFPVSKALFSLEKLKEQEDF